MSDPHLNLACRSSSDSQQQLFKIMAPLNFCQHEDYMDLSKSLSSQPSLHSDGHRSFNSLNSETLGQSYESQTSNGYLSSPLGQRQDSAALAPDSFRNDDDTNLRCRSTGNVLKRRMDWFSGTVLFLSIFSTVFSGLYLVLALKAPKYGSRIRTTGKGGTSFTTASTLSALFAKLIELSFVTVFISFLGQLLSRQAFKVGGRGITLSELSIRTWIIQPGNLLTHVESIKFKTLRFLGPLSLIVSLTSIFYTTASEALVTPSLKFDKVRSLQLSGPVTTSYANLNHLARQCTILLDSKLDNATLHDWNGKFGQICLGPFLASTAHRDFAQFYANWSDVNHTGIGYPVQKLRPNASTVLYGNTTITGSWIGDNGSASAARYGRRLTNVTLVMPHSGIFKAARDPINNILQPELSGGGVGQFKIRASLPSPAVNVLCAGLTLNETQPFALHNNYWDLRKLHKFSEKGSNATNVLTAVDDIFGFNFTGGRYMRPLFDHIPDKGASQINITVQNKTDKPGKTFIISKQLVTSEPMTYPYELCAISSIIYTSCSTHYKSSIAGGYMSVTCDKSDDKLRYDIATNISAQNTLQPQFAPVAATTLGLVEVGVGNGAFGSNYNRLLNTLIALGNGIKPSAPSYAEAIAVVLGGALVNSVKDSPFVHYWNLSETALEVNQTIRQSFIATLQTQQYASGSSQPWQNIFHAVLLPVFLINLVCLAYLVYGLVLRRGNVTDFTEPQNLFTLSMNSPPSDKLAGSCGGGPENDHYSVPWFVKIDEHDHVYLSSRDGPMSSGTDSITSVGCEKPVASIRTTKVKRKPVRSVTVPKSRLMESYMELNRKRKGLF